MKTTSKTINGLSIFFCLAASACNNGSGGNNSDSTLGNNTGDSIGWLEDGERCFRC